MAGQGREGGVAQDSSHMNVSECEQGITSVDRRAGQRAGGERGDEMPTGTQRSTCSQLPSQPGPWKQRAGWPFLTVVVLRG